MAEEKTRFQEHVDDARRRRAAHEELEARRARAAAKFKASINEMVKLRAGQDFFAGLFNLCTYNRTSVITDPNGEVLSGATGYNDARRSVYVDIRKQMDPEMRCKIELLAEIGPEDDTIQKEK